MIAFEADQVISPALLGDVTTGFLLALHRDPASGAVTIADEEALDDGFGRPVLSADGAHLYVPQQITRAIAIYDVPEPSSRLLGLAMLLVIAGLRWGQVAAQSETAAKARQRGKDPCLSLSVEGPSRAP